MFTNRFAILHPERVRAAAAGSPGGWPLAPVSSWQGETLPYNVGISDVDSLLGHSLDMTAVRTVPTYLYMGDADTNDSVPFSDSYDDVQREQVNRLFGTTPVQRWPHAEEVYRAAGMNATFVLYPGVGHTITSQMFDDVASFFTTHLRRRVVSLRHSDLRLAPGPAHRTFAGAERYVFGGEARDRPGEHIPPLHEDPPPAPPPAPADPRWHTGFSGLPVARDGAGGPAN